MAKSIDADQHGMQHVGVVQHMACTGGTTITRCLGSLPDVVMLTEISGESNRMPLRFDPLAVVSQFDVQYPDLQPSREHRTAIVIEQVAYVADVARAHGKRLLVRTHSEAEYMRRSAPRRSNFRDALDADPRFTTTTLVTVRYPPASWASLKRANWAGDLTYIDYCERYLDFLDCEERAPVHRYEAFTDDPDTAVAAMARALGLPYDPSYRTRWTTLKATGDSGRGREMDEIRPLTVTPLPPEQDAQLQEVAVHRKLCDRLGYPVSQREYAAERTRACLRYDPDDSVASAMLDTLARRRWLG